MPLGGEMAERYGAAAVQDWHERRPHGYRVARSRFWFTAAIGFAELLVITACTSDYESIAETYAKNMAVIHQSAERQMALLREKHEYDNRLLACITAAGELQIGVATEKDLPCRSVEPTGQPDDDRSGIDRAVRIRRPQWLCRISLLQ
jgi:hypothetical protein